jgi:hypothetical protein
MAACPILLRVASRNCAVTILNVQELLPPYLPLTDDLGCRKVVECECTGALFG